MTGSPFPREFWLTRISKRRQNCHFSIWAGTIRTFRSSSDADERKLRMELAAARGTIETLHDEVQALRHRLEKIPGYALLRQLRRRFRI